MPEQMVFWVKQLWATSNGATRIFGSGGPEKWVFRPYFAPPRPYGRSYGKNVDMYRKAIAKPTKKGHCDQVRSAHRFSATDRRTAAMVDFLPSEKTQNGPFFADTQSKPIFSQKGPISKWKMFTFLPKQCLGTVNSKGLPSDMPVLVLAQNGTFYAFYAFYAPRVQRQTHVRVHTSPGTTFDSGHYPQKTHFERRTAKNWPELILGLCPTAPEGVGCVFFRVTASRAKRAFWPMASPLASLAGWIR